MNRANVYTPTVIKTINIGDLKIKINPNVRALQFSHSKVDLPLLKEIVDNLWKFPRSLYLDLSNNLIDDDGCYELASNMSMLPALVELDLSNNNITNKGLEEIIVRLPAMRHLKYIYLTSNPISLSYESLKADPRIRVHGIKGIHI